jgi:hypothetical protein
MKKYYFFFVILCISIILPSCNRKTGCPAMSQEVQKGKKGNGKKEAQSRLFSKKSKIKYYNNRNTKN